MKRPTNGRGLFLTRDSGGKHEMTPGKYVEWAASKARKLGVKFTGTTSQIDAMIRDGRCAERDLFIDFDVKGNVFSRAGLNAIKAEIRRDLTVSHIFIPNRDRLRDPMIHLTVSDSKMSCGPRVSPLCLWTESVSRFERAAGRTSGM